MRKRTAGRKFPFIQGYKIQIFHRGRTPIIYFTEDARVPCAPPYTGLLSYKDNEMKITKKINNDVKCVDSFFIRIKSISDIFNISLPEFLYQTKTRKFYEDEKISFY